MRQRAAELQSGLCRQRSPADKTCVCACIDGDIAAHLWQLQNLLTETAYGCSQESAAAIEGASTAAIFFKGLDAIAMQLWQDCAVKVATASFDGQARYTSEAAIQSIPKSHDQRAEASPAAAPLDACLVGFTSLYLTHFAS